MPSINRILKTPLLPLLILVIGCSNSQSSPGNCRPIYRPPTIATYKEPENISIYWDTSGSMAQNASLLTEIATTLDSRVLPLAGKSLNFQHYAVGSSLNKVPSADSFLQSLKRPAEQASALELAALQLGEDLGEGTTDAAVVVSDMDLSLSPGDGDGMRCSSAKNHISPAAGPEFGNCFVEGIQKTTPSLPDLFLHVFALAKRSGKTKKRPIFITILAQNPAFGRSIVARMEFAYTPQFRSVALLDSSQRSWSTGQTTCSWGKGKLEEADWSPTSGNDCTFLCSNSRSYIDLGCSLPALSSGGGLQAGVPIIEGSPSKPRAGYQIRDSTSLGTQFLCNSPEADIKTDLTTIKLTVTWPLTPVAPPTDLDPQQLNNNNINILYLHLVNRAANLIDPPQAYMEWKVNDR